MPQMPIYATLASTGVKIVNVDYNQLGDNVSVAATFSSTGMTASYTVEFTLDDAQYLGIIGSTKAVSWFPDSVMGAATSSGAVNNYLNPIAGFRFTLTAVSSGFVTFTVLQG